MMPTASDPPVVWALWYGSIGIHVHPAWWVSDSGVCICFRAADCPRPGKHPIFRGWSELASTNSASIRRLWARYPHANVALAAGRLLDVLDVDHRDLTDWQQATGIMLPVTWTWRTGSGNWQVAFAHAEGLTNRVRSLPFADVRTIGGQAVLPPSRNRNGAYTWLHSPECTPLAPWPPALLQQLRTPVRQTVDPSPPPAQPQAIPAGLQRFADEGAPAGERNARAFWLACRLRQHGVDEREAVALLERFAAACRPALTSDEIRLCWHSSARSQGYDPGLRLPQPQRPRGRTLPPPVRPMTKCGS